MHNTIGIEALKNELQTNLYESLKEAYLLTKRVGAFSHWNRLWPENAWNTALGRFHQHSQTKQRSGTYCYFDQFSKCSLLSQYIIFIPISGWALKRKYRILFPGMGEAAILD